MCDFDARVSRWKELARAGSPEAAAYYDEHVFPAVVERVRRTGSPSQTAYDIVFLTLGTSPWPLALTLSVIRWQRAVVLGPSDMQPHYDHLVRLVQRLGENRVPQLVLLADPDAVSVYRGIRDTLPASSEVQIAIDVTGGTKAMVAGATMAAGWLDADLLYVESRYLSDLRAPEPGTERVVRLADPLTVFGDVAARAAYALANAGDYAGAAGRLAELQGRAPSADREAWWRLAEAYAAFERLEFAEAAQHLDGAIAVTKRAAAMLEPCPLQPELTRLAAQAEAARSLAEALNTADGRTLLTGPGFPTLWAWLRTYAERRQASGQFDQAALVLYRLMELMCQRRLAHRGFDTANPAYDSLLDDGVEALRERYIAADRELRGRATDLPEGKVALRQGLTLLKALDDAWVHPAQPPDWQRLLGQTEARNLGLFAHGFQRTTPKQAKDYAETVDRWADWFAAAEGWDDAPTRFENLRFLPFP